MKKAERLYENAAATEVELNSEEIAKIDELATAVGED